MELRYLIYRTDFNYTVVRESTVSGTTGLNESEIYTDFLIPVIQPLYYWRFNVDEEQISPNSEYWISEWENYISPATPNDFATLGELTGATTQLQNDVNYVSGITNTKLSIDTFSAYTGNTETEFNYIDADLTYLSGQTNTKLAINTFNVYSGNTASDINNRLLTSSFNTFTGVTLSADYISNVKFNTYTGNTGLQQVTEINAITNIESTFGNGIVVNEIRPSGGTASAITINKSDGLTPLITIDTISGLTGFGTINPQNKIHIYGTYGGDEDLLSTQPNSITVDGIVDGDKDIVWADEGTPKWLAETYRGECGKFWYLYNVEGNLSPITASESGRIGINSPTNIIDYGVQTVYGTTSDFNRLIIGGIFDKNFTTVYQIQINSTTGNPNTYIWRKSIDLGFTYGSWSIPTGCTTGTTVFDSGIEISFVQTTGFTLNTLYEFTAFPQLAPSTLSMVGNRVNAVLISQDYTADPVVFLDITANANTSETETPFSLFNTGTTLNAGYIGTLTKIDSLFLNVIRAGADIILVIEYWNGSNWVDISVGNEYYLDGTSNLTKTGSISWDTTNLTDWIKDNITEYFSENELYWIRIRTSSPATITPLLGGVARGSDRRFTVYSSAFDAKPSFYVDATGRVNIGGGNISGTNKFQINCSNYVDVTAGLSNSLMEIDSNCSDIANIRVRSSSDDSIGGGYVVAKTRGTLDSALNVCSGDSIGHLCFRARVNDVGVTLTSIESQYVGDCTTLYSDILFKTSSGSIPIEKVRISNLGTGFGVTNPTATIHLKNGSTSIAPLKFTSGALLTIPQTGAFEYDGNAFYGTTGSTRKTFAFLESPYFSGNVYLPTTTCLGGANLCAYVLNSGGTNNICLTQKSTFITYTGATNVRLNDVENDIDYISGITDTKLPTTTFAAYTGTTIPWVKVDKTGSSLADLATRNASDVNYANTDWDETNAAGMLGKLSQYIEDTQISGRLTPETVLYQIGLNELYVDAGSGYITYDTFHKLISWSAQTLNTSGYTLSSDIGTHYVYIDSNGDLQSSLTEPDNIHNIRLGSFYWALQIGNIRQDGGIIANALARTSDYFTRMGYFIYDNGGNIELLSAGTTTIVSTPCRVQVGLMPVLLPQVATTLADISGLTMMVNYNSPDQGVNADFHYINKSFYYGDASLPTTYYNDPTQLSGLVLTAYTFNFTYGSNIVTSPDDLRTVLPTGDSFQIYDAFDGDAPYIYQTLVTGHTWDGTGTTLTLAIPYFGAGGTGRTAVVSLATKNIPSGKWVKAIVLRTTSGQLSFYLPQTYYDTIEGAIAGTLPFKIPPFDTTTLNMAYVVYSAGSTTFAGGIYDIRPLPFSYQIGGQIGGGGGVTNHGDLTGLGEDDHTQYLRTNGIRNLTGIQKYQSHPTFTSNTDIVDKKYVDDADATRVTVATFNAFTGNTYTKAQINTYTGATNTQISCIRTNYISGATNLGNGCGLYDSKLGNVLQFKSLSGGTNIVLSTVDNLLRIDSTDTCAVWGNITGSISGQTDLYDCLNARLTCTTFGVFTGTTLPASYYNKSEINAYSAATQTKLNSKANLSGGTFTGAIYAPTAALNSSTTQVATTAFVTGQAATAQPLMNGVSAIGTSLQYARQDHVHPSDASKVSTTNFNTFTGTTLPANYYNKTQINVYTGATNTRINLIETNYVSGATNLGAGVGIYSAKSGKDLQFKSLSGGTNIILLETDGVVRIDSTDTCADWGNITGLIINQTDLYNCLNSKVAKTGDTMTGRLNVNSTLYVTGTTCLNSLSTGSISTDSTLMWNPTSKAITAVKLTGGSDNYHYRECTSTLTTTITTAPGAKYLGYTASTFTAGRYQVDFNAIYGHINNNAIIYLTFNVDNVIQGTTYMQRMAATAPYNWSAALSRDVTLTAGTHCFDIRYWGNTASSCVAFGSVRVKRIL